MDKQAEKDRWSWVPAAMPGVSRLLAEQRKALGVEHVRECWKRGVNQREPGWFFAREGALAVGTPWAAIADVAGWEVSPTQAMVFLRPVEGSHGGA